MRAYYNLMLFVHSSSIVAIISAIFYLDTVGLRKFLIVIFLCIAIATHIRKMISLAAAKTKSLEVINLR